MSSPQQPGPPTPTCSSCGGPDDGEFAICKYCKRPYSAEIAQTAIPCLACRTSCRWGKQRCGACSSWLVVSCVFCGALSPHNQSACLACREAFAGAPQRRAQREAMARRQQNVQTYGVVGNVAASFVGAMAGGAIMGGYHGHYHPSWDSSSGSYGSSSGDGPPVGSWGGAVGGEVSGGGLFESGGSSDGGSSDGGSSDGGSSDGGSSDGGSSDGGGSDGS